VSSWVSSAVVHSCIIVQLSNGFLGNIMDTNFAGRREDGETMPRRAQRGPWCGRKILCKPGPSGMWSNHDVKLTIATVKCSEDILLSPALEYM
jgi:hypothetical protein